MNAVVAPKTRLSPFDGHRQKQNNRPTTPPQTHILLFMPRPKGIVSCHKSGTGNNQGRQRTTTCDNWCFDIKDSQSKSNEFSSSVIPVPTPLNY